MQTEKKATFETQNHRMGINLFLLGNYTLPLISNANAAILCRLEIGGPSIVMMTV